MFEISINFNYYYYFFFEYTQQTSTSRAVIEEAVGSVRNLTSQPANHQILIQVCFFYFLKIFFLKL